jgi:serine/threonine-protein kinase
MNEDDDIPAGDKTVFIPRSTPLPQDGEAEALPSASPRKKPAAKVAAAAEPGVQTPEAPPVHTAFPVTPRNGDGRIQVGDVLNHMFEVRRFIARGGMGEVFEGVNINSDERVAIKVILPALAADANVVQLFKNEAKTLMKLTHPALVKYRTIATEPQLGVLYIVTEYVEGTNLEDALPALKPSMADLVGMLRQLAEGLAVAHAGGAIHRDISPDNVLLEDGQIGRPRIIDFGIAKDLDPSAKTIVGDGFAGKLNFVAPEQLGDFDRQIGPWTDVYSLGLVILAVAQGRPVSMGGTLVDAVDKRRQGPDLSGAPEALRPLLAAMLKPNQAERLRSMNDVLTVLDGIAGPDPAHRTAPPMRTQAPLAAEKPGLSVAGLKPPVLYYVGGAVAAVLVLGIVGAVVLVGHKSGGAEAVSAAPPADPQKAARAVLDATLPTTNCAWLDVSALNADASGVDVDLKGVAADTPAVQGTLAGAFAAKGLKLRNLKTEDVAPINDTVCPLLNEYMKIRTSGPGAMSMPQVKWTMQAWPDAPNVKQARPVVNFSIDPQTPDMVLYGLETNGAITALITSKAQLSNPAFLQKYAITDRGNGNYQFAPNQDEAGWSGLLLVEGAGPMDASLLNPDSAHRGPDWQQKFRAAAAQRGWHSDMIWLQAVPG